MTETIAAGRKTDREDPFEKVLIAGIADGNVGVRSSLAFAETASQDFANSDRYDRGEISQLRSSEIGNAIGLLKAIAEITLAAAKLRGEFNHRYDVTRRIEPARAVDAIELSEGEGVPETEGSIPQENIAANDGAAAAAE